MPPDVGVVITAAGRGARLGGTTPKQFREIGGTPMLLRAARPFLSHPEVARVVVTLPPEFAAAPPSWLADLLGERLAVVAGGDARMDSVELGLAALPAGCVIVLVHDGARPFPDAEVIAAVIGAARSGAGAVAAVPVGDTLKEAQSSGPGKLPRVLRTMPRDGVWRAQTPQGFPRGMLESAYRNARQAGFAGTDEASLVEQSGALVCLVEDVTTNLKVTTPADLRLAEALAAALR